MQADSLVGNTYFQCPMKSGLLPFVFHSTSFCYSYLVCI